MVCLCLPKRVVRLWNWLHSGGRAESENRTLGAERVSAKVEAEASSREAEGSGAGQASRANWLKPTCINEKRENEEEGRSQKKAGVVADCGTPFFRFN